MLVIERRQHGEFMVFLNTGPVAVVLLTVYRKIHSYHVNIIQMLNFDDIDILRCRWSTASSSVDFNNECNGICSEVPGVNLIQSNCAIVSILKFTS